MFDMNTEIRSYSAQLKLQEESSKERLVTPSREIDDSTKIERPIKTVIPNDFTASDNIGCNGMDERNANNRVLSISSGSLAKDTASMENVTSQNPSGVMSYLDISDSDLDTSLEGMNLSANEAYDIACDSDDTCVESSVSYTAIYALCCRDQALIPVQRFQSLLKETSCDLSNCLIGPRDMKPISVALVGNYSIQVLNLSGNFIGSKGVAYLADALTENVYISDLHLSNVNMGGDGLRYLVKAMRKNKCVRLLDISGNNLGTSEAHLVSELISIEQNLQCLNLSHNSLDENGGSIIANSIGDNEILKRIDLSWNHLRHKGAEDICKAIGENICLEEIDLSWNGLGEEGMKALSTSLAKNHVLKVLNIANCRIDFLNLPDLLTGLMSNEELVTLNIGKNTITTDGAIAVIQAIQQSKVSKLNNLYLTDVPVNDDFVEKLLELQNTHPIFVRHPFPTKKKVRPPYRKKSLNDFDPSLILFEYAKKENFRLIDLFRTFDTDSSNSITKQELQNGFTSLNIPLTENSISRLLTSMDLDENREINFEELRKGQSRVNKIRQSEAKDDNLKKIITDLRTMLREAQAERKYSKANKKFIRRQSSITILFNQGGATLKNK
ncbi:hypothetical protein ScPMuIL_010241 [Solemya velum]